MSDTTGQWRMWSLQQGQTASGGNLCTCLCPGNELQIVWHAITDYLQLHAAAAKDGSQSWILVIDSIDYVLQHTKLQEVRHAQSIVPATQMAHCHTQPVLLLVVLLCNAHTAGLVQPLLVLCTTCLPQLFLLLSDMAQLAVNPIWLPSKSLKQQDLQTWSSKRAVLILLGLAHVWPAFPARNHSCMCRCYAFWRMCADMPSSPVSVSSCIR